jgi:hypothetical protein
VSLIEEVGAWIGLVLANRPEISLLGPFQMARISSFCDELWYSECLRRRGEANGRGARILEIRVWFLFWKFWDRIGLDFAGSISFIIPKQWQ